MNRIYQGRVTKAQRLKADATGSLALLPSWPICQKWSWTNGEKAFSCQWPSATDHLFSAIEEGRILILRRRGNSKSQRLICEFADSIGHELLICRLTDLPRIGYSELMRPKFFTLTPSFKYASALTMLGSPEEVDTWLEDITWRIASEPTSADFPVVRLPDLRCAEISCGPARKRLTVCIYFRIMDEARISLEWLCLVNSAQQELLTMTTCAAIAGSI